MEIRTRRRRFRICRGTYRLQQRGQSLAVDPAPCDGVSDYHSLAGRSDGEVGAGAGVSCRYLEISVALVTRTEKLAP